MRLDLLRRTALFADLDDAQLARVAELCTEQTYPSGTTVFKEGEPGNRLFVVMTGGVRISRQVPGAGEEALAVLGPGACFGEMAVFDRSERSTDAIASQDTTLLSLSRPDLEMLLEFDRELAYVVLRSVIRMLSARLRSTNESLRAFLAMSMF